MNSMINKRLKDVLFTDQWSDMCMETVSRFGYVLVSEELTNLVAKQFLPPYDHVVSWLGSQMEWHSPQPSNLNSLASAHMLISGLQLLICAALFWERD